MEPSMSLSTGKHVSEHLCMTVSIRQDKFSGLTLCQVATFFLVAAKFDEDTTALELATIVGTA